MELLINTLYKGFIIHPKAYLRNPWRAIDVVVIVSGFIELIVYPINSFALRIIRVIFRPLKAINSFPSKYYSWL